MVAERTVQTSLQNPFTFICVWDFQLGAFGDEVGGLSGLPVKLKSTQTIADLYSILGEQVPIIGVGGVNSGDDALEKLAAGAKLIQIYSGLIYQGPGLVKQCVDACRDVIKC